MGAHQKNTGINLEELPMAERETIWATKYIALALDYNPKYAMDINK